MIKTVWWKHPIHGQFVEITADASKKRLRRNTFQCPYCDRTSIRHDERYLVLEAHMVEQHPDVLVGWADSLKFG